MSDTERARAEYRAAWDAWAAAAKAREPAERCRALWQEMNAALDRLEAATLTADEYAHRARNLPDGPQ